jgi:hypothetical protein
VGNGTAMRRTNWGGSRRDVALGIVGMVDTKAVVRDDV